MRWIRSHAASLFLISIVPPSSAALAQSRGSDEYTRYELLAPESASFKIIYDITAVTPGARFYFNPIRKGSEASDESVLDLATGEPVKFEEVTGKQARDEGEERADLDTHYLKVHLRRPVPEGGEVRIRIIKTYKDKKSYFAEGDAVVFDRPLGIKRNIVVLPLGYELDSCNIPSQVLEEPDGRIAVSFVNDYPQAAPLLVKARKLPHAPSPLPLPPKSAAKTAPPAGPAAPGPALGDISFPERARQEREIVYFLNPPESHSFHLYHDYTEWREGVDRYVNVVRPGSKVSEPSARLLDSGEKLETETLSGEAAARAAGAEAEPGTEVVLVHFPAVRKGQSARIRIEETYADPDRYGMAGERLVWHRSFGRVYNDLVLPDGWFLTASSIPATVSREADGRVRLSFVNRRPDEIDVLVTARRR
jgi:hypothetical protein